VRAGTFHLSASSANTHGAHDLRSALAKVLVLVCSCFSLSLRE
jgi:hypothetical protein